MKFGLYKIADVEGAILAHSVRLTDGRSIKKGTVLTTDDLNLLAADGFDSVNVAIPEEGDILEDAAAERLAGLLSHASLTQDKAKTGRVNFFAKKNGLFRVSKPLIDAINAVDPGITIATLQNNHEVNEGRMVATIKIIPYGLPGAVLDQVQMPHAEAAMEVSSFNALRVGLIQTRLEGTKPKVLDKTRRTLERRLQPSESRFVDEIRIEHDADAVCGAIHSLDSVCDLIVLFGASAISDARDVIPSGLGKAGGETLRFGMPVDPGNLLLLGRLGNVAVIGAPGCARGTAENGFDWVLNQVLCGTELSEIDIAGMGVGGLLMETGARPHPRTASAKPTGKTIGLILAAGQSRRMGEANKMTVPVNGKPMVRHVAEAALASRLDEISVVTGFDPKAVKQALKDLDVSYIQNDRFEEGLSTSLEAGISRLKPSAERILIMLGDMPFLTSQMIDDMIEAGRDRDAIVMATSEGKRGNPVLWPKRFFEELLQIEGDTGARHLIGANADQVVEVEIGAAAATDLDTPEAVAAAQTR